MTDKAYWALVTLLAANAFAICLPERVKPLWFSALVYLGIALGAIYCAATGAKMP